MTFTKEKSRVSKTYCNQRAVMDPRTKLECKYQELQHLKSKSRYSLTKYEQRRLKELMGDKSLQLYTRG